MNISLIVAVATNGVIGRDGALPWHISEDLKRFKQLTIGKPIIMGRLTHESIGKPLPDRRNIVISSRKGLQLEGCEVVATPDDALELAGDAEEVMVIGGRRVYADMLPRADRIYMTRIHSPVDGDTYFPELNEDDWQLVSQEDFPADESTELGYSFIRMDRIYYRAANDP